MKTIYLDRDFKCHVSPTEGWTAIETDAFDGKCDAYIEGYRLVPAGSSWTRSDGIEFAGEMLAPWRDSATLERIQADYERELLAQALAALAEVGVVVE